MVIQGGATSVPVPVTSSTSGDGSTRSVMPSILPPRPDLFQQLARDEELHDLVGAGADAHQPRVAEDLLDREVARVADAAQHLHGVVDDLPHVLGDDQL